MILPMTGTWILLEFSGICKTRNRRQNAQNIVVSGMCWNALGAAEKEDCSVVVMKRGNARGAKGVGYRHCLGSTGNGRNPMCNGRRQPSRDGTSRMN